MKKKILSFIICFISIIIFAGCDESQVDVVTVNVSNNENISGSQFGEFIGIGSNLTYDSATRIVYIKNYTYGCQNYVYTPYYASNGLPYRYNPETNTFEEIVDE